MSQSLLGRLSEIFLEHVQKKTEPQGAPGCSYSVANHSVSVTCEDDDDGKLTADSLFASSTGELDWISCHVRKPQHSVLYPSEAGFGFDETIASEEIKDEECLSDSFSELGHTSCTPLNNSEESEEGW
eukprot:12342537-Karenia_brevis.AAC.1